MDKKILIAMDDSDNAMRAVEFAAGLFDKNSYITLLSVLPDYKSIREFDSPSLTPTFQRERSAFSVIESQKKDILKEALRKAHKKLLSAGFAEDRVQWKIQSLEKGIARDIIRQADSGFDAVVLGKRGLRASSAFFFGSISQKVLQGVKSASLIVVS